MRELEAADLVEKQSDGRYKLGITALLLGGAYVSNTLFAGSTDRALRRLAEETGESAYLGVLDGAELFVQSGYEGRNGVATASLVGRVIPANCVAMGKVLLARLSERELKKLFRDGLRGVTSQSIVEIEKLREELATVRELGFAREEGETHLGLAGVALPLDGQGSAGGATAALRVEAHALGSKDSLVPGSGIGAARSAGTRGLALGISMSIESSDSHRARVLDALRRATARLGHEAAMVEMFGTDSRALVTPDRD
jgi:DNA-binding IclR family transcriptional regulator